MSSGGEQPLVDPAVRLAWRLGRHAGPREVDLLLRVAPARLLGGARPRLEAMGLPLQAIDATLARVHALSAWPTAWTWAAQRSLADARQARTLEIPVVEATATRQAALAYGVAAWLPSGGTKELRTLRATAAGLFARSLPLLDPATERVEVVWRTTTLPGYLVRPPGLVGPMPIVLVLNGLTTTKEELLFWVEPLLWQGLAVLTLDWPGTGEAAARAAVTADCDDLASGVFDLVAADPTLDPRRVAVLGISLGGALAVRIAAADRRFAAVVAVTPPFDARPWLSLAGPLLQAHLAAHAGGADRLPALATGFALPSWAGRVRAPLLVLGAGRDLVVPPAESVRLASAVGAPATLFWYAGGGHSLFNRIPLWTADAARWLADRLRPPSTRVDGGEDQAGE